MSLWTLNKVHRSTFKVKQSDFISYIRKVNSIPEFRSWLSQLKKDHYDSDHACWAYRIYENRQLNTHFSDAGEPAGTAGPTIMRVLKQFKIVQGSIVVVRYFGGIQLGKRGLINAYHESATNVVNVSKLVRWKNIQHYEIECPLKYVGVLSKYISEKKYKIIQDRSDEKLKWTIQIDQRKASEFIKMVGLLTLGEGSSKRA